MSLSAPLLATAPIAAAYCVAYSGGLDSTVLLHMARAAGLPGLSACHVHHGLQPAADDWARQCQAQCAAWSVPMQLLRVQVAADHPQGPESAARTARYAALSAALPRGTVLMTAHHAGDQAETVLLRLLRGTGIEGLAAMQPLSVFGADDITQTLWRPLLKLPRAALLAYAQQHGLQWLEDPHNQQPRYARSWLRANVMPLLRQRWPDADAQLGRAAEHAADAAELLQGLAEQLLPTAQSDDGGLSISRLLALSAPQRRLLLRHWLRLLALPPVAAALLHKLDAEVLMARADAMPLLCWPGGEFRRYRDRLYAGAPLPPPPELFCLTWDGAASLRLPAGLGQLSSDQPQPMQVRFATGGERIKPAGDAHTRTLRLLCQQAGIPPWWRLRLPLVFIDNKLVSVAGHWNTAAAPQLHWQVPEVPGLPLSWRQ